MGDRTKRVSTPTAKLGLFVAFASLVAALAAVCVIAVAGPQTAAAQAPPNLTGEIFICNTATPDFHHALCTSPRPATAACDPAGTASLTFDAEGIAAGPYPGTFKETGRLELGPISSGVEDRNRRVTDFVAEFTIESTFGEVSGTKRFVDVSHIPGLEEFASGYCETSEGVTTSAYGAAVSCYEAKLPDGSTDRGVASSGTLVTTTESGLATSEFLETFNSLEDMRERFAPLAEACDALFCGKFKEHKKDKDKDKCKQKARVR